MFRYIAFVWNGVNPAAQQQAQALTRRLLEGNLRNPDPLAHWHTAVCLNGLAVFHAGTTGAHSSKAYLLHDGAGAVLGRLFSGAAPASPTFAAGESAAILRTEGKHLVENYWGRYVAFLHDPRSATTWVLRDPSLGLPCLTLSRASVQVFFSVMEDAIELGLGPFSLNWPYLTARLCYQILELRESGLLEVSRILGGECLKLRAEQQTRSFYWNPFDKAAEKIIDDPALAAAHLRQLVRDCVHAWSQGHANIVHTLSGGLDSSIVMTCLRDAPARPRVTCVNYYSPGSNSDERLYARAMAREAGYELLERERDLTIRLDSLLQAPRSAYPVNCRYYLENSQWEAQLVRNRRATALFCGEGGDQLFYQARAIFAAGDYLCRHGLFAGMNPQLFRVAMDAARLDRVSVWTVLRDAFGQAVLRRRWKPSDDLARFKKLVAAEVLAEFGANPRFQHPLFHAPGSTPSGKLWHAYQLTLPAIDFYDPLGLIGEAERIAPLSSQPLLELCLRIPTDVLVSGGWDRAIARRAFQHDLPLQIAIRRAKGGLDEYSKALLSRNIAFIRELLLDGELIRESLIDSGKLQGILSGDPTRLGDMVELFDLVNLEAWLQCWRSEIHQAAA